MAVDYAKSTADTSFDSQMSSLPLRMATGTLAEPPSLALEINHIDALPTELKLAILAWTGVASPRALWALSSTNRELRLLSESLRWKVRFSVSLRYAESS